MEQNVNLLQAQTKDTERDMAASHFIPDTSLETYISHTCIGKLLLKNADLQNFVKQQESITERSLLRCHPSESIKSICFQTNGCKATDNDCGQQH